MAVKKGDMVFRIPIYLEFIGGKSKKFWEIGWIDENSYATMYGRIGAKGAQSKKNFSRDWKAREEYRKILNSKLNKGYKYAERPADRMDIDLGLNESGYMLVTKVEGDTATVLNDRGQLEKISIRELGTVMEKE